MIVPSTINSPHRHLLTIADFTAHLQFWKFIAETATNEQTRAHALRRAKREQGWIDFHLARVRRFETWGGAERNAARLAGRYRRAALERRRVRKAA